jgi:hypothetical protein
MEMENWQKMIGRIQYPRTFALCFLVRGVIVEKKNVHNTMSFVTLSHEFLRFPLCWGAIG